MSEREKIIETMARVYCDTGHIQGFLYGDQHVIRDLTKRPGKQEIFRASVADCTDVQFAAECELARRRVEAQAIKDALDAAGYAIVRRDAEPMSGRKRKQQPATEAYTQAEIEARIDRICGCVGGDDCDCVSVFNRARVQLWTEYNGRPRAKIGAEHG
jgi:hypothetical protein